MELNEILQNSISYKDYFLSRHDGMPPLWPRPPLWPDGNPTNEIKERFYKEHLEDSVPRKIYDLVVDDCEKSREKIERLRHLCYLVKLESSFERKTADEWARQLLPVTGWKDTGSSALGERNVMMNSLEWITLYRDHLQPLDNFVPPPSPVPFVCWTCRKPCLSRCACEELFCSRQCLKVGWDQGHRRLCEKVVESRMIDSMLTQFEMINWLDKGELRLATMGDDTSAQMQVQ
jgi:hypothetical protein